MFLKSHLIGFFLHFLQKTVQFLFLLPFSVLGRFFPVLDFNILILFCRKLGILFLQCLFIP